MGHEEQAVQLSKGWHVLAGLVGCPPACRGAVGSGRNLEFLLILYCVTFFINIADMQISSLNLNVKSLIQLGGWGEWSVKSPECALKPLWQCYLPIPYNGLL